MKPKFTLQQFVARWRKTDLKRRSGVQARFMAPWRFVGYPTPAEAGFIDRRDV